jgi:spore coat protein U-like protein
VNLNRRARLFFVLASLLTGLTCTQNLMAASCSISSLGSLTNLQYDPGSGTLSAITFNITCYGGGGTVATVKKIALSIGSATISTDFTTRIMQLSDNLSYQLYRDSTRTIVWGDGAGGSNSSADTALYAFTNGQTRNFTIYVMIPALQNIYSGTYTVTPGPVITITW